MAKRFRRRQALVEEGRNHLNIHDTGLHLNRSIFFLSSAQIFFFFSTASAPGLRCALHFLRVRMESLERERNPRALENSLNRHWCWENRHLGGDDDGLLLTDERRAWMESSTIIVQFSELETFTRWINGAEKLQNWNRTTKALNHQESFCFQTKVHSARSLKFFFHFFFVSHWKRTHSKVGRILNGVINFSSRLLAQNEHKI